jgi:hypothetical protein
MEEIGLSKQYNRRNKNTKRAFLFHFKKNMPILKIGKYGKLEF